MHDIAQQDSYLRLECWLAWLCTQLHPPTYMRRVTPDEAPVSNSGLHVTRLPDETCWLLAAAGMLYKTLSS
jgi:hypothetical protein